MRATSLTFTMENGSNINLKFFSKLAKSIYLVELSYLLQ